MDLKQLAAAVRDKTEDELPPPPPPARRLAAWHMAVKARETFGDLERIACAKLCRADMPPANADNAPGIGTRVRRREAVRGSWS